MTADTPPPLVLTAPAEAAGARLDKWLADAGTGMSRSRLRVLIEDGGGLVTSLPEMSSTIDEAVDRDGNAHNHEKPPL